MTREIRIWLACLTLSALGAAQACAMSKPPATKPECSDAELAKIEAAYIAEATEACAGKTYDSCPELADVRAKYQAKEKEFVQCH